MLGPLLLLLGYRSQRVVQEVLEGLGEEPEEEVGFWAAGAPALAAGTVQVHDLLFESLHWTCRPCHP